MAGIIWLASYPKSGNTWTRAFLANYLMDRESPLPINEIQDQMWADNAIFHFEMASGKKIEDLSRVEIANLRPKVHSWIARSRSTNVLLKTHNLVTIVDGVPLITPSVTAGAVYVVRNPLDVAVSFAHHYQIDLDKSVDSLCDIQTFVPRCKPQIEYYISHWSRHVSSWINAPGLTQHLIRYEDMLDKTQETFGALVAFLGLPQDQKRLERAIRFSSFKELKQQESEQGFVEGHSDGARAFFRNGKKEGWREVLSRDQVSKILDTHRDMMLELGYLSPQGEP